MAVTTEVLICLAFNYAKGLLEVAPTPQ